MNYYNKLKMHKAGLIERFLSINDDDNDDETTTFCYCEKGSKTEHQPSIIFIHGFSSNKLAWIGVIKNIPNNIHCIAIDMPGHGESSGFAEEQLIASKIIDKLKQFFDKLNLIEPMCFVGCSMGGSIVAMFATKYKSYVAMICLLAPVPPGKEYETKILKELRSGKYHMVLPETTKQVYEAADAMTMKKVRFRRPLAKVYLKLRSSTLDQHKKVLDSAFENDYPNLEKSYGKLKDLPCSALIIWGRQDQLCAVEGAYYFSQLIPNSELIIFDKCGHLIIHDKRKQTAKNIVDFWKNHCNDSTRL